MYHPSADSLAAQVNNDGRELTLVHTGAGHNKFWKISRDPENDRAVRTANGRLGTRGQVQKPKILDSPYSAAREVYNRIAEKLTKGYRRVGERELERLNTQAAIVGSQNKCESLTWVELVDSDAEFPKWREVSDNRLADPNYDPVLLVHLKTRKPIAELDEFWLMFTPEGTSEFIGWQEQRPADPAWCCWTGRTVPITPGHRLHDLAQRVETALGREF